MDFGYVGEQLTFMTRSRAFLIAMDECSSSSFLILLRAILLLFDSRLLIDCQCFFETAGEKDRQSEQHSSHSNCYFFINGSG